MDGLADIVNPRRTALDLAAAVAAAAAVVAIAAAAPSTTYTYAQSFQIGAVVGTVRTGDWLLPRDHYGGLARKPQLYAWLDAPVLMLTGAYNDFTFRLPTVLAMLAAAVLVYFLGRRWFDRRVGLMAACLWATVRHMGKLAYLAVTDMLLAVWVLGAVLCADRLLFHRAPPGRRGRWAVGLWAMMILGALTKGWGVLNYILIGGMLALATAVGPQFGPVRAAAGWRGKGLAAVRLIARRWGRAARATRLGWGMLASAAVLGPVWAGMFIQGGEEFAEIVRFEFWARVFGTGPTQPLGSSVPAVGHLLYYALPASVFMVLALVLAGAGEAGGQRPGAPRRRAAAVLGRWFSLRSPVFLPLCLVLAVVVPFSLTHGFRPDYLLPCYGGVALMGAWAIDRLARLGPAGGRLASAGRHVVAAVPLLIGLLLVLVPAIYLFHDRVPPAVRKNFRMPSTVLPVTWWALGGLVPAGAALAVLAVRWSLRWRLRLLAGAAVVGMLGVTYLDRHVFCRQARTRDGEKMLALARQARERIGGDPFAVHRAGRLNVELYLGRFGQAAGGVEDLNRTAAPWLITCDRGLMELGATEAVEQGGGKVQIMKPGDLGRVEAMSDPVVSERWGRMYLIRLRRPIRVSGTPRKTADPPGREEDM